MPIVRSSATLLTSSETSLLRRHSSVVSPGQPWSSLDAGVVDASFAPTTGAGVPAAGSIELGRVPNSRPFVHEDLFPIAADSHEEIYPAASRRERLALYHA